MKKEEIFKEPKSSCACLNVEYRPTQHGEGATALMSDNWQCALCGANFQ